MNLTTDGHSWTEHSGLRTGDFACEGVVNPPEHFHRSFDSIYDVVVIGAGYAGLSAARDLATAGDSSETAPAMQQELSKSRPKRLAR